MRQGQWPEIAEKSAASNTPASWPARRRQGASRAAARWSRSWAAWAARFLAATAEYCNVPASNVVPNDTAPPGELAYDSGIAASSP